MARKSTGSRPARQRARGAAPDRGGAWLPAVTFEKDLRDALNVTLHGFDAGAIIRELEEVATRAPALRETHAESPARALRRLQGTLVTCRQQLAALDNRTHDLLHDRLALRGSEPGTLRRFVEALGGLEGGVEDALAELKRHPVIGRPKRLDALWLAEQTAAVLTRHGVPLSAGDKDRFAEVVGWLWPTVMHEEEVPELRPWLRKALDIHR